MDIQFYGANCIVLSSKQARVVIDDNLKELGGKSVTKEGDICLFTSSHSAVEQAKIVINQPGEYEASGVSIFGLQAQAHMDEQGQKNTTMFKITFNDVRIVVTGHIFPKLSESALEAFGVVDVLFVPVGGNGYTLDGEGAMSIIKDIDPKLVIPTHYDNKSLHYPVPQQKLEDALKAITMEPRERVTKLQLKPGDLIDTAQLVIVESA
ncbi:MAG: MBL fold metallo-hydrolase [Candidatus Saccharimonadales bacterium]